MPPWDGEVSKRRDGIPSGVFFIHTELFLLPQVAAFISSYNGRWPSKLDKNSLLGKQRHNRRTLVVRSARWRSAHLSWMCVLLKSVPGSLSCKVSPAAIEQKSRQHPFDRHGARA
jgi:hypothetical protein